MPSRRNELLTGLLVMTTIAVLAGVLILLGAPGLFRPVITYRVYFDNAAGIKLGAPVLLAGRKIGQVQRLYSPVSPEEQQRAQEQETAMHPPAAGATPPATKPYFEVRVDVQVDKTAKVYRDSHARMITLGLLGETAIDFTQGTEASGLAHDGEIFAGERAPDFSEAAAKLLEVIEPVAKEATATMKELEATAQNLSQITAKDSELDKALGEFKTFGEHLVTLTAPDGPLTESLDNVRKISDQLAGNDNIKVTLQNFRRSSEQLNLLLRDLGPVGRNIAEFSETVKTQPWRLIWPSTKKYPSPAPSEASITVRKSARAKPTPGRNRRASSR
jgi:ABC-type transporter Mla subunit MlaD